MQMAITSIFSDQSLALARLVSGQLDPANIKDDHWEVLTDLALDHGLAGMLLWSLRKNKWVGAGDARFQPLVDAARRTGRLCLLQEKSHHRIVSAFFKSDIPAIWLKGMVLARKYYPEPHLRPMVDMDVLVKPETMKRAKEALIELGYRPAEEDFFEVGGFVDRARHHECFIDYSGEVKVELHFRLLAPSMYHHTQQSNLNWFWGQTEDHSIKGPPFLGFKPEANLLHLCGHTILQNYGQGIDLLHLLDLHLLVSNSKIDWDIVTAQASVLKWTIAIEKALEVIPDLFGTTLPEGLIEELRRKRSPEEELILSPGTLISTRRWDEWRHTYNQISIRKRFSLIWTTIFPPANFMRHQYGLPAEKSLFIYYIRHLWDGSLEVMRAVLASTSPRKKRAKNFH